MKDDESESEEWSEVGVEEEDEEEGVKDSSSTPTIDSSSFDIVIPQKENAMRGMKEKRPSIKKEDRLARILLHKSHLLCLLVSAKLRNRWSNDALVKVNCIFGFKVLIEVGRPLPCR
jgi:xeroderma pigmentosum group C-complementing protein